MDLNLYAAMRGQFYACFIVLCMPLLSIAFPSVTSLIISSVASEPILHSPIMRMMRGVICVRHSVDCNTTMFVEFCSMYCLRLLRMHIMYIESCVFTHIPSRYICTLISLFSSLLFLFFLLQPCLRCPPGSHP